jgi:predicted amidohydrolase
MTTGDQAGFRVAAAAYPLEPLHDWAAWSARLSAWVADGAATGARLLVFPEYAAMELAYLAGPDVAGDEMACRAAVSDRLPEADALHADLAARHGVHILAGSAPCFAGGGRPVNRARLFAPSGAAGHQDKLIPTPYERDPWDIAPGGGLVLFDTALGRLGVLICYDSEFPLPARALAEAGAGVILIPSCTETPAGASRVRIAARARALENQCVTVAAPLIGPAPWCPPVATNTGRAGIYGPPDLGFPDSGILAEGAPDAPGWVVADTDPAAIDRVRAAGHVRGFVHWPEQTASPPVCVTLR